MRSRLRAIAWVVASLALCACAPTRPTSQPALPLPGDPAASVLPPQTQEPPPVFPTAVAVPEPVPSVESTVGETTAPLRERAARHATALIGVPYRYGGATPEGFDCSGLVHYAFAKAGRIVPRDSLSQKTYGARLDRADALLPGDLLFFRRGKRAMHVALYIGDGRFVHAPSRGGAVRVDPFDAPHWKARFIEARRIGSA